MKNKSYQHNPIKIFFSYSHEDEKLKEELEKHLIALERQGIIDSWSDSKIDAGDEWKDKIESELQNANIILLLISSDFLVSTFCYDIELKKAIERHNQGEAVVIPIILRPVVWDNAPFSHLQALPNNAKPVTSWKDLDSAFHNIVLNIQKVVTKMNRYKNKGTKQSEYKKSKNGQEESDHQSNNIFESSPNLIDVDCCFDRYDNFIDSIVTDISENQLILRDNIPSVYLDVINDQLKADFLFVCEISENKDVVLFESSYKSTRIKTVEILKHIISSYPNIYKIRYPVHIPTIDSSSVLKNNTCSVIPLSENDDISVLLVVFNQAANSQKLDVTIGTIIQALYESSSNFQKKSNFIELKSAIADKLKYIYNYVSDKLFNYRLELFKEGLKNIEMYFEPIMQFDKFEQGVTIWGWEALARSKKTKKTPVSILKTAELWGLHFQTELDIYCLQKALQKYQDENTKLNNFRYGEKKPLTVNVFPNTILRTNYKKLLHKLIVSEKLIPKNTLVLEISEKTLIQASSIFEEENFLKDFQKIMNSLKKNLSIDFAIDDFGVGNSSITRLNKLLPAYVKIDRDILHFDHDLGKQLIKYVISINENIPGKGINVIIEGLDSYSKISLKELVNELDVEYIQGHKFSRAKPSITERLEKQIYKEIYEQLDWPFKS